MADIRKRAGKKGTTYQVRHSSTATKSGYAFKSFDTLKEARAFVESGSARSTSGSRMSHIRTIDQAIDMWLDICEREGRDERDPVSPSTLENYRWRARTMRAYAWDRNFKICGKLMLLASGHG